MQGYKRWPEEDRRKTQDPEAIFKKIGLRAGMTFADVGCGEGYFAIPAAGLVGPGGRVYGIDTDGEAIGVLKEKAAARGLDNIRVTAGDAERKAMCKACADVVFFGICLHDFGSPETALKNALHALKPGGILADLDWKKVRDRAGGPPYEARFSEKKASKLIGDAGFKIKSTGDIAGRYYLILAEAP